MMKIVKCCNCDKSSDKSEWNEYGIGVVDGKLQFVGGCPYCKGQFYKQNIGTLKIKLSYITK